MSFFETNNPVLLLVAFILLIAVLKGFLSKREFFIKRSYLILPLIIIIAIFAVLVRPVLQVFSSMASMISVLLIFIVFGWILMAALGVHSSKVGNMVKEVGFLRLTVLIIFVCIIALSLSQAFGNKLLNEPSVSFGDAFIEETGKEEIDFSPLFTSKFLGFGILVIVLGMIFVFVNIQ